MKLIRCIALLLFVTGLVFGQDHNKGVLVTPKSEYWDQIQKDIDEYNKKEIPEHKVFKLDFTGIDLPKGKEEFKYFWHNDPLNQGNTGTCWCFSTTSFLESEINRLYNEKVKLSEMWTVYWEYVEKARRFVQERGNSAIGEGSEANAVTRIWKGYGIVPEDVYPGMLTGQKRHDHGKMFREINDYLTSVRNSNAWDTETVLSTVKSILNHYLGEPPVSFTFGGIKYTPKEYLQNFLKLNPDDYVSLMSLMEKPYYEKAEYEVPDNWWHSKDYYNVPLDVFMAGLKNGIRNGYTMEIFGDVSEPGIDSHAKAAVIPTFDIPNDYIDENARQMRFSNGTTGDDHGIHLIGYENKNGKDWFLIKDSGSGSFNSGDKGYYFFREDYVKLKILGFLIHKDAVKEILANFK
jgi:bleomycin hydrolase